MAADGARGTVAIFATANHEPDPRRLDHARAYFVARGYDVVCRLRSDASHQRFAGSDNERLRWLVETIEDRSVDIAIAQRGGYGATRLLPRIPFAAMAAAVARGVRFVGHSDFTAISLGLLATTGAISFAGPMASFGFGGDIDTFAEACFWTAMDDSRVDLTFAAPGAPDVDVGGVLWGGNLAMIASLVGTPWLPAIDGGILFVEDVNEQPYRIERMLLQLAQAGVLDRQRLVLCGAFTGYRPGEADGGYDLDAAIARVALATSTPIVRGLPFGHVPRKATLAVGAIARATVVDERCRLVQRWTLRPTPAIDDAVSVPAPA